MIRIFKQHDALVERCKRRSAEDWEYKNQAGIHVAGLDKLIKQMERTNPLRRIVDGEHAQAILSAHSRHTQTNYDELLDEGRTARESDPDVDVQEYAWARLERA